MLIRTFTVVFVYHVVHVQRRIICCYMMTGKPVGKFFLLRNPSTDLVLEIQDGVDKPRTQVVTAYQREGLVPRDRQLWFIDQTTSTIRSKLNFYCLDIENGKLILSILSLLIE